MNDDSGALGNILMKYLFPRGYAIMFTEGQAVENEKTLDIKTGLKKPTQ